MAAKGYWIARISVHDPDVYAQYAAAGAPVYAKYGARIVVRGGQCEKVEGEGRDRNVVIEFPSYEIALEAYNSPEYQAAAELRRQASEGEFLVIEGYDGAQPGQ